MKVLVAVILAIGSVSALGSGPYLPSGWRPKGPSFFLPSEVEKPSKLSESPLKETLLQETEASGSDALREYGPPKLEVVAVIGNQGLPDVVTEQAFYVEAKSQLQSEQVLDSVDQAFGVQENTEQVVSGVETVTEGQLAEISVEQQNTEVLAEAQPTFEARAEDVVAQIVEKTSEAVQEGVQQEAVVPTAVIEEVVVPTVVATEEVVVPTAVANEEVVPTAAQEEIVPTDVTQEDVSTVASREEAVVPTAAAEQDVVVPTAAGPEVIIPEAVVPTAEAQEEVVVPTAGVQEEAVVSIVVPEDVVVPVVEEVIVGKAVEGANNVNEALAILEKEVKAAQILEGVVEIKEEISGSLEQTPEGFLEYGPPGFREYGPPKAEVATSAAIEVAPTSAFENNEVRRRRYSPKFRSQKKH